MAVAVSASGVSIPLFFVFRRKNHRDYFIARGPDGSAGSADKSGWMTGDNCVVHVTLHIRYWGHGEQTCVDSTGQSSVTS